MSLNYKPLVSGQLKGFAQASNKFGTFNWNCATIQTCRRAPMSQAVKEERTSIYIGSVHFQHNRNHELRFSRSLSKYTHSPPLFSCAFPGGFLQAAPSLADTATIRAMCFSNINKCMSLYPCGLLTQIPYPASSTEVILCL